MKVLIDEERIKRRVRELAEEIRNNYRGNRLIIIVVLKGSFVFGADLIRELGDMDIVVDFIRASTYGMGTEPEEEVKILLEPTIDIKGERVLIVDDILDTGYTLRRIKEYVLSKEPLSCEVCVLLDKPARRKVELKPDYVGFEIPNYFVFGYGIDWAEKYRNLPYIAHE
ncbi:MAG: hypoxanthine phosphoribosyltransferase [Thermosulfidibacteraceae bacterium]|jgi:hypoxanthine phosphoribosyltransferase